MDTKSTELKVFESSIKEHSAYLFSFSYRLTGSFEDAKDLLQETLFNAWKKWGYLKNRENPVPWLRKICINLFIDGKRKPTTRITEKSIVFPDMTYEIIAQLPSPEDEILADEEVRLVHSQCFSMIVSTLPLYQRIVFVLNGIYQVGISETSLLVKKSNSATKSLLHRAREKMVANFGSHCKMVDLGNACECKSWVAFAHDIEKRRDHLNHIISSKIESKQKISDTRKRIKFLFNNLPHHPPPPLWIEDVIKKLS